MNKKRRSRYAFNVIILKEKPDNIWDTYYLRQNKKDIIIGPCIIFDELYHRLPVPVVIEKGDLMLASHNCTLFHYDIGFTGKYSRRIMTLQKDKETKFDKDEGSYIVIEGKLNEKK